MESNRVVSKKQAMSRSADSIKAQIRLTCKRCGSSRIDTTYEREQRGDVLYHWVIDTCTVCQHVGCGRSY